MAPYSKEISFFQKQRRGFQVPGLLKEDLRRDGETALPSRSLMVGNEGAIPEEASVDQGLGFLVSKSRWWQLFQWSGLLGEWMGAKGLPCCAGERTLGCGRWVGRTGQNRWVTGLWVDWEKEESSETSRDGDPWQRCGSQNSVLRRGGWAGKSKTIMVLSTTEEKKRALVPYTWEGGPVLKTGVCPGS